MYLFHPFTTIAPTEQTRRATLSTPRFSVSTLLEYISIPSLKMSVSVYRETRNTNSTTVGDTEVIITQRYSHARVTTYITYVRARRAETRRRTNFAAYTHLRSTTQHDRFLVAECHSMPIAE